MNGSQRISPSLSEKPCSQQEGVQSHAGFTLLEVMVVLAVLGVLTMIAVPEFQTWIEHGAVNNATTSLYLKLKQARTQAVAESRRVRVVLDAASNAFVYDDNSGGACSYCKHEKIKFSQFSPEVKLTTNRVLISFNTMGVTADNATIKVTAGNYLRCIKVNKIGRAYIKGACP